MNDKLEDETFPFGPMIIDSIAETEHNLNVDIIPDGEVSSVRVMSSLVFGHCLEVYPFVGLFTCNVSS